MSYSKTPRVLIEGLDGCGKSTAALEAAGNLSEIYPSSTIKVVDSSGVHIFNKGSLANRKLSNLESWEPHEDSSRLGKLIRLGAFTTARRLADSWMTGCADMILSVRDPFRIDPAAYLAVYAPGLSKKIDTNARLRMFDRMTVAPHPDKIIHIEADMDKIGANFNGGHLDPSETPENLLLMSDELPKILHSYQKMFNVGVTAVEGLKQSTSDDIATFAEPYLYESTAEAAYAGGGRIVHH